MAENLTGIFPETYTNPVYKQSFPDPFVLKFRGEYFAYCTDFWRDGKVFGVLRSRDLINWEEIGGAIQPLENSPPFYWAPEVTYYNGKFYLYYSVGNETLMELRVAVSDIPDGNFVDSGKRLTNEDFAIDAHVFTDEDGQRYLFYATDFLEHSHIGTGTVIDKMVDFFTLAGHPRPVTRARYDWQVYDENRKEKGGVRWHTVEGSFVLKRKGIYYEMFSGGNWQNITYGVSFATTDNIGKDEEWEQFSDGEKILPILRTLPGIVTGPGHNSVVRGLNNREIYCVYHRWTDDGRVLAVDRMDFTGGERIYIKGATTTPQPTPFKPTILDFFDELSRQNWELISGKWETQNNQIVSENSGFSEVVCRYETESYLLETSLRILENTAGKIGIYLKNKDRNFLKFYLDPNDKKAEFYWFENGSEKIESCVLPNDFDFQSFHLWQAEVDYKWVKIRLDEQTIFQKNLDNVPLQVSLAAENCRAAFSGFSLTNGFEELFEQNDLKLRGWKINSGDGQWQIEKQNLVITNQGTEKTIFEKPISKENFELTFNLCFLETFAEDFQFSIDFLLDEGEQPFSFSFTKCNNKWILHSRVNELNKVFSLPEGFSLNTFRQFSLLKINDKFLLKSETEIIGILDKVQSIKNFSFAIQNASIAFDMIRLTIL